MTVTFLRRPSQKVEPSSVKLAVPQVATTGTRHRHVKPIDTFRKEPYNKGYYDNPYKIVCRFCGGQKKVLVYDECPTCYGESKTCQTCNGTGEVKNYINCPECRGKNK